jgi:hypothetical protein
MGTCSIDVDMDGSPAEFYKATRPRARKQHIKACAECGGDINRGEVYELVKAKWEGQVDTIKTCPVCLEIRKALFCSFYHFGMWAELEEQADEICISSLNGLSQRAINKLSDFLQKLD